MVKISASYPGASALTVSQAVATPIEQEINGTPGMLYMESNSSNSGGFSATVTFDVSADPDLAAVEIQNRVKLAESRLPAEVDVYKRQSLNYGRGRSRIIRVNQDKQIEVYYAFPRDVQSSKDLLGGYRSDIDQLIASYNLPSGVAVQVFHEEDEFGDFKFLILAAFLLIFMILASVFESVVTPFVLLFTIPLAAIGSLLALLLSSNSLMLSLIHISVSVVELKKGSISKLINTTGTVQPTYGASQNAEMSGFYKLQTNPRTGKPFKMGDRVSKGELIIRLEDKEYENGIAIDAKKLSLEIAEQEQSKQKALYEKGGVTMSEMRNTEVKVTNAGYDYENAKLNLEKICLLYTSCDGCRERCVWC